MTGATGVELLLWRDETSGWRCPPAPRVRRQAPIPPAPRTNPRSRCRCSATSSGSGAAVVDDAVRDERFARDPYFAARPLLAACVPDPRPRPAAGGADAGEPPHPRRIHIERLDAVKLIAGQLAVSLDNSQLYADFRRIAEEQAALRRVATLVAQGAAPQQSSTPSPRRSASCWGVDFTALTPVRPAGRDHDGRDVGRQGHRGIECPFGSRLPLGGRNVSTLVFADRPGGAGRL